MNGKPSPPRREFGSPRAIGALTAKLVAKPLGKRGFAAASLVAGWPAIVGETLASGTLPLRVAFARGARTQGVLHLRVASGALALQLQHLEPLILERVNVHFGHAAVSRLALTQGPVPRRAVRRPAAPPPEAPLDAALAQRIEAVPDAELRDALAGLGRLLAGARRQT